MNKLLFVFLSMLLCLSSCTIEKSFSPKAIDVKDASIEEMTVSSKDQEIILTGVKEGELYGIMPLENGSRSIVKYRTNRNPLGSYIF